MSVPSTSFAKPEEAGALQRWAEVNDGCCIGIKVCIKERSHWKGDRKYSSEAGTDQLHLKPVGFTLSSTPQGTSSVGLIHGKGRHGRE